MRDEFPGALKEWLDGDTLFCAGRTELLQEPCVSVIGTRNPSEVGLRRAKAITRLLARSGYCIVSGLAIGVDAIAHLTALEEGANTIAVLGTPLDRIYPTATTHVRNAIESRGLVISQFPNGGRTYRSNFPKRNRLMAALCHLTVVVEASESSGTRHQVTTALELGREVAIPVSLANSGVRWVVDAVATGRVHVLHDLTDLTSFLPG